MSSPRLGWNEIPTHVRRAIEGDLGATVERWANQTGGFSPGLAARCDLSDGRTVFIKATSPLQNPDSPGILLEELETAALLPRELAAPRLLQLLQPAGWVAGVFEWIDGRMPHTPWVPAELDAVIDALGAMAELGPLATGLPGPERRVAHLFDGWRSIVADPALVDRLDPWARDHLDHLVALEERWPEATAGTSLVHGDIRGDNVLLTDDGRVVIVDWAYPYIGAGWVDLVAMLPSVAMEGGGEPADVLARARHCDGIDPEHLDIFLAALAGFFVHRGLLPDPPGLPTVRQFQRDQGAVTLRWLRSRSRWS